MLVDEGPAKVSARRSRDKFLPQSLNDVVKKRTSSLLLKTRFAPRHTTVLVNVCSHTSGLPVSPSLQQVQAVGIALRCESPAAMEFGYWSTQWQPGDKSLTAIKAAEHRRNDIVPKSSAACLEEFYNKRFFDPAGMTETTFWPSEAPDCPLGRALTVPNKDTN